MNNNIIDHLKIVLVETSHPGNIGATARAMKTMGIKNLRLVLPGNYPSAEATVRATGADDILASAEQYESFQAAIMDCNLVFATSARTRSISWPVACPEQAAQQVVEHGSTGANVALVFGRESSGLTNEELENCNAMLQIPTNPDFSSLNLASAVQIACYEIFKVMSKNEVAYQGDSDKTGSVTVEQMNQFYEHLQQCTIDIGYLDPENPRLLMRRLKRLFNRIHLDSNEYNILRGILAAVEKLVKEK